MTTERVALEPVAALGRAVLAALVLPVLVPAVLVEPAVRARRAGLERLVVLEVREALVAPEGAAALGRAGEPEAVKSLPLNV